MNEVIENVYIGDVDDAADLEDGEFSSVITVNDTRVPATTAYHPLQDGENSQSEFGEAVDAVRAALREDGSVFVHCTLGISRSASVLATAIAAEKGVKYSEALNMVRKARPSANPAHELTRLAKSYLGEQDARPFEGFEE